MKKIFSFLLLAITLNLFQGQHLLAQNQPIGSEEGKVIIRGTAQINNVPPGSAKDSIATFDENGLLRKIAAVQKNGLDQPGYVSWSGSGLTFDVTSAVYYIDGERYTSPAGSIILDAADGTNPRYDVIALDNTGAIVKITGTASSNPEIPQIDPATQVYLTAVSVPAGATTAGGISLTTVYDEHTEWTASNTAGLTINYDNTSPVYHGSKSIDVGTWSTSKSIIFTNSSVVDAGNYSILKFFIKLKSALPSTTNINVLFLNGSTAVSNVISLDATTGFSKTNTLNFQNVTLPTSAFTFTSTFFDKIRITFTQAGSGLYLDYVQLQGGITTATKERDPNANSKTITNNQGAGVLVTGTAAQTLNSNPAWTFKADTNLLATRAWRDKLKDSLTALITLKQTQLNGTGFVKATGTTISYDNSTYTPTSRTLTINGTAQDLSSDRTFTISTGPDTVNVSNVLSYGADTTGTTDATAAFNNAINAALVNGKMRVYAPHGTYKISISYLVSGGTATNNRGVELKNNIELFGDGVGKTILTIGNNATQTTTLNKIFPIINGIGTSNTKVHDLEISGNKLNQNQYTANPNTNPTGYYSDTSKRWSTPGILYKDGDNNEAYNVYIHDCQNTGILSINNTRTYVHHSRLSNNGGSGVTYFIKSTGLIDNIKADHNTSDNVRFDSCYSDIKISNSDISWSGYGEVGSSNGFANIYCGGDTKGLIVANCHLHNAEAYGFDQGSARWITLLNNNIEYNGNGGIVTSGYLTVTGGELKNNGKRTDGTSDGVSNYNPGGIVVNSATELLVNGVKITDTASGYQTYAVKSWGGGGSTGFNKSNIQNCIIKGVADTAHLYGGNTGTNNLHMNLVYDLSGTPLLYGTSGYYLQYQSNGTWLPAAASSGGVTAMSAFTNTSSSTGATISGSNLQMTAADTTNAGEVNVSTSGQYFLGPKFFSTGNNGITPGYGTRGISLINRNTALTSDGGRTSPTLEFNTTGTHSNGGTAGAVDTAKFQIFTSAPVGFNGLIGHLKILSQLSANAAATEMDLQAASGGVAFSGSVTAGSSTPANVGAVATFFGSTVTSSTTLTLNSAGNNGVLFNRSGGSAALGKWYGDGNFILVDGSSSSTTYPGTEQDAIFSVYQSTAAATGSTLSGGSTVTALTQAKNRFKVGDNITINGETKTITALSSTTATISGTFTNTNSNVAVTRTAIPVFTAQGNGQIGMGTATPQGVLDITSTTGGVVLPRMTKTQRDAINSPVAGTAIYQTDNTPGLRVYNGTNWMKFTEATD